MRNIYGQKCLSNKTVANFKCMGDHETTYAGKGRRPMKDQLLSGIAQIIFGAHFCSGFSQAGSQWVPVGGDW